MMRTKLASARAFAAAVGLAAIAGLVPAFAGDLESALDFARHGQIEKAEALVKKILESRETGAADKAATALVRSEVLWSKALLTANSALDQFLALADESSNVLRDFLEARPSPPHAAEARRGLDWRLLGKAERTARSARTADAEKRRTELERRAWELYEALERHFKGRLRDLRAMKPAPDEDEVLEVLLTSARALLESSRLPGAEDGDRKRVLAEAVDRLEELQFDYANETAAFEALLVEGSCLTELRDYELAQDRFLGAVDLGRRLRGSGKQPTEHHLSVIRGGLLALTDLHLLAGQPREAVGVVDQAFRDDAALERDPAGLALKLQKAEALFQLRDEGGAQTLASQVLGADPDGKVGALAKEKLRTWSTAGLAGGGQASPDKLLLAAGSLIEDAQWSLGMQLLRSAIEASTSAADRQRYVPEAYLKLGQAFAQMGKHHEAAAACRDLLAEFPESDLAPIACFEAVRALNAEHALTGWQGDNAAKEVLLALLEKRWPSHPVARNVAVLQAERLEREKRFSEAADLYLKVPDDAEAWESALVGAGRAYYLEGAGAWEKGGGDKAKAVTAMGKAKEALGRFFERARNPQFLPRRSDLLRARLNLVYKATQQLALILSHEAVGEHVEALQVLADYEGSLPERDPRRASIWALKVKPSLAAGREEDALRLVDSILEQFPHTPSAAAAAKTAAVHLETATDALVKAGGDAAVIVRNLERLRRYYLKWFNDSRERGSRIGVNEAIAVAQTLFTAALRTNGLERSTSALLEARRAGLQDPQAFADAAQVFLHVADAKQQDLGAQDRIAVLFSLARCERLLAASVEGWERARDRYLSLLKGFNFLDDKDQLNAAAFTSAHGQSLLSPYIELGTVYNELAKAGQGSLFDKAFEVFQAVGQQVESGSEPWWVVKYMTLVVLCDKGSPDAVRIARIVLENVDKSYPDHDGNQFQMKARLAALKERLSRM